MKTGGGEEPLVSSSLTASASIGLIVRQEDASSASWPMFTVDAAGATPGESTEHKRSRGPTARLLAYIQTTKVRFLPGLLEPKYANWQSGTA